MAARPAGSSPVTAYCTILATNYLPKALSLATSLRRHHPDATLTVLLIDVRADADLPAVPEGVDVHLVGTDFLGLPEREVLDMVMGYELVEFATAVKPVLLCLLLEDADQAVYLDPDTWVTAPMVELPTDLAASRHGLLLTPHFLEPASAESGGEMTEGHLLHVGVFNLGFCAVDRRASDFLDWWWGHLRHECLTDPLSGLFVDQKWVDIGAVLFAGDSWQHPGYNVSVANLHERPVGRDEHGYFIESTGDRLRLFHFHAFDTSAPEELSTRFSDSTAHLRSGSGVLDTLCREYASVLASFEEALPPAPAYAYASDTSGRRISRALRRVYRTARMQGEQVPSPFLREEAAVYERWRRSARMPVTRAVVGDVAKGLRVVLPEQYARAKARFPRLTGSVRGRYVERTGFWG